MVVIKVLVQGINVSVISVNALQRGLNDSQRDNFYENLNSIVRKLEKKESVVIAGDCNGHVGNNGEDCKDQHGGYGYGVTDRGWEAKGKSPSHVWVWSIKVDYCLVMRN